ncbi:COG4705 family protein [Bradyrhizobium tropiciagri]|uniref:COG4705 family protein n=1 Tax=Bradyrhizobium tropiciagri TaxID=312253 RepID=UPI00067E4A7D|nr:hypothetical protein [Bradyrhizobium tropiciagri]
MDNSHPGAESKVAALTFGFWIIKIFATTLGEVGGNALSQTEGFGYLASTAIFGMLLIVAVVAQIRAERFYPSLYWCVIVATTLAGTTMADLCDRSLGIGYLGGSLLLFSLVIATLALWYRTMGSVAINTVTSPKVEAFYWTTIMFSQTLGTALGDWMADSTGLGYNGSALLIGAALVVIAALYYLTDVSHTFLFWAAFILTRPLGATLANSLDKPAANGGLGINDVTLSAAFAVLIIVSLFVVPQQAGSHAPARRSS